ncbi:MAG: hypothetical protein Q9227_007501 [Pyrenula ochraceoflavens]
MQTEDDFTNFLEEFDNGFSALENIGDGCNTLEANMEPVDMAHLGLQPSTTNNNSSAMAWEASTASTMPMTNVSYANAPTSMPLDPSARRPQHTLSRPNYHRQHVIPPTPTSDELHGGAAYYTHGGPYTHPNFEGHRHFGNDPAAFTPLVSPAVTPLDLSFGVPEFTVPGEYFSPLTSPAIEAQNSQENKRFEHHRHGSDVASPADMSSENQAFNVSAIPATKKLRRRPNENSRSNVRSVGKSPMVKAQSRRKRGSANLSPVAAAIPGNNVVATSLRSSMPSKGATNSENSGQDSVSPEPLTDALMPPPALPRSNGRSPVIVGKASSSASGNEPATPATLMKLQTKQDHSPRISTTGRHDQHGGELEDLQLPDAAASATSTGSDNQATPTISGKTPNTNGQATPRARPTSSAGPSPQVEPILSPSEGAQSSTTKPSLSRSGKKRQSTSSSQISPALRPKISPSIKPLVPQGVNIPKTPISAETSALYLASKSNYQNILEGTHLPGVSYPETLAENLSSKRTSHKIAEQGRRNRINTALKEIEALLPPSPSTSKKSRPGAMEGDDDKTSAANQNSSKANTVEMAIVYIRDLQKQLAETQTKLDTAEKKLSNVNQRERSNDSGVT